MHRWVHGIPALCASDANHSLSWTYDALGRVTGKGLTVGTITKSVGYGYTNGDLTALVTPSGQAVAYGCPGERCCHRRLPYPLPAVTNTVRQRPLAGNKSSEAMRDGEN